MFCSVVLLLVVVLVIDIEISLHSHFAVQNQPGRPDRGPKGNSIPALFDAALQYLQDGQLRQLCGGRQHEGHPQRRHDHSEDIVQQQPRDGLGVLS